jgi:hypothetical protein
LGVAAARVELGCERPDAFEATPEGVKARLRRAAQEAHALARDPLEEAAWGKVLALDPASTRDARRNRRFNDIGDDLL